MKKYKATSKPNIDKCLVSQCVHFISSKIFQAFFGEEAWWAQRQSGRGSEDENPAAVGDRTQITKPTASIFI